MLCVEVKLLELLQPSGNFAFRFPELLESSQCCMVHSSDQWAPQQVGSEMAKEVHQGQELPTSGTVILLGLGKSAAAIGYNSLNSILDLGEYGTNSMFTRISVHDKGAIGVWKRQNWS